MAEKSRKERRGFFRRIRESRGGGEYEVTLNRVHDRVVIREGDEALHLTVESDPMRMVAALTNAQARLSAWNDETTPERRLEDVRIFAEAIFGEKQTDELLEFYHGDGACVMNVCSTYFGDRLGAMVTKAQKKALDRVREENNA